MHHQTKQTDHTKQSLERAMAAIDLVVFHYRTTCDEESLLDPKSAAVLLEDAYQHLSAVKQSIG